MKKIRILIAEEHKLILETWVFLLNGNPRFKVVAACRDSSEAVCLAHLENPDVVLMDIHIHPIDGFEAAARILLLRPDIKIIGLSAHNDLSSAQQMFLTGAKGFVTKNSLFAEIEEAILCVYNGGEYACSEIIDNGFQLGFSVQPVYRKKNNLTNREVQVSRLIKDGLDAKDISAKMSISVRTVEAYIASILKKFRLKTSLSLVHYLENLPVQFSAGMASGKGISTTISQP